MLKQNIQKNIIMLWFFWEFCLGLHKLWLQMTLRGRKLTFLLSPGYDQHPHKVRHNTLTANLKNDILAAAEFICLVVLQISTATPWLALKNVRNSQFVLVGRYVHCNKRFLVHHREINISWTWEECRETLIFFFHF